MADVAAPVANPPPQPAPPAPKDEAAPAASEPNAKIAVPGSTDTQASVTIGVDPQRPPLSEDEFRAMYLRTMREAQERRRAAAAAATAPPVAAPHAPQQLAAAAPHAANGDAAPAAMPVAAGGAGDQQRGAVGVGDLMRMVNIPRLAWSIFKLSLAAAIFGQGGRFTEWFVVLCIFKLASVLFTSVKFRINRDGRRDVHPDDEHFSDEDDVRDLQDRVAAADDDADAARQLAERRAEFLARQAKKRRLLAFRRTAKCVTTFFVSVFPSWRIENLHAELIADGLMRDESRRRRPRAPRPAFQQPANPPHAAEAAGGDAQPAAAAVDGDGAPAAE